ncbi:CCS1 [Scenedesmus sp. PABB004]|nr:CCS1 [Scenedesmus sp. PABB004]
MRAALAPRGGRVAGPLARPLARPCAARRAIVVGASGKQRRQPLSVQPAPDVSSSSAPPPAPQPAAPPPLAARPPEQPGAAPAGPGAAAAAPPGLVRLAWRRLVRELSSLPRAIAIMAAITALSALGTVIPQNKPLAYYVANYPDDGERVLGFLDYHALLGLGLDHIYSAWYFYAAIALLGASLAACTATTQWPAAKVARRWRFADSPRALSRHGTPAVLPRAALGDLAAGLAARSYQVFSQGGRLYAFKGLAGRLGPIGVHAALLLVLGGTAYSGFGGWKGTAMVPEGQEFVVGDALRPASALATTPGGARTVLQVNRFSIDTRPDGSVAQFYSDLTLRDAGGQQLLRKTISVNDPFRWGGVTMYQTDWSLAALTLRLVEPEAAGAGGGSGGAGGAAAASALLEQLQGEAAAQGAQPAPGGGGAPGRPRLPARAFNLPLASLEGKGGVAEGAKLYATFLPLEPPGDDGRPPRGISMLARDLETATFYDSKGQFVGVRRAGSGKPIEVEGVGLVLERIVGSTGLEIKSDPGVPLVYAGFGGLMITTLISYVSHSQVWALQQGGDVYVVGRSNRSKVLFNNELDAVLDAVPEAGAERGA